MRFAAALLALACCATPRDAGAFFRTPVKWGSCGALSVSHTAWLDWHCVRGDSGGVAWGSDGAAVCMLTACDVDTGLTYCEEMTP